MNIYFCGSMTGSQEKKEDYKELITYLKNYGNVLNEFVGEKIVEDDANKIYLRDTSNLKKADVLIADVTIISTGVGFELGYADLLPINSLVIYDNSKELPSSLILGNPNFTVKGYNSIDEAKQIIKEFMTN